MVFKNICILVLWMKVVLALEGMRHDMGCLRPIIPIQVSHYHIVIHQVHTKKVVFIIRFLPIQSLAYIPTRSILKLQVLKVHCSIKDFFNIII